MVTLLTGCLNVADVFATRASGPPKQQRTRESSTEYSNSSTEREEIRYHYEVTKIKNHATVITAMRSADRDESLKQPVLAPSGAVRMS